MLMMTFLKFALIFWAVYFSAKHAWRFVIICLGLIAGAAKGVAAVTPSVKKSRKGPRGAERVEPAS